MELAVLALVTLIVRVAWWTVVSILRIFAFLFFAPFFPKKKVRQTGRPIKVKIEYVTQLADGTMTRGRPPRSRSATPVTSRATPVNAPSAPPVHVPSRDEQDCAIALKQLGYPKPQADKTAREVCARLGPSATLDQLIKESLRELGRVRS